MTARRTRLVWLAAAAAALACGDPGAGGDGDSPDWEECRGEDADGDGTSDAIEKALGTDAGDPADHPDARGMVVFVMPYQAPPEPASHDLALDVRLARADVAILIDTSGSMAGTVSRIGGHLEGLVTRLAAEVDDLAFGAAGYGDVPSIGANSEWDVPFYLVHRVMTARTPAGLASIVRSFDYRNIITDGLGPWLAIMRGGDEPEQGWEALRQAATGVGLVYPDAYGERTEEVPAFDPDTAHPSPPASGEEVGARGGLGFRDDALPILIQITDTEHHDQPVAETTPALATRPVAFEALAAAGAKVVGTMAWKVEGHDDLVAVAKATGARVPPGTWGSGEARPENCPEDRCCLVGEDPDTASPEIQPLPDPDGLCTLVFRSDRYDTNLGDMMARAVLAIARAGRFAVSAVLRDDPADDLDVAAAFAAEVEALAIGDCLGADPVDTDGDGRADTFPDLTSGARACFRLSAGSNTTVEPDAAARAYRAILRVTGDSVAAFGAQEVFFVVPGTTCAGAPPDAVE
ncbi:MAG TPA: hypothetical protein VFU21_02155 [Kofleriaceae bacterium]|nr:hypothetical protein [Kofleriaceae bacterium]